MTNHVHEAWLILKDYSHQASSLDKLKLEAAAAILAEKSSTIVSVHCTVYHVDGTYFHGCYLLDSESNVTRHTGRLDKDNNLI